MTQILALLVLSAAVSPPAPIKLTCPARIATTQELSTAIRGWHASNYEAGSTDRTLPVIEMGITAGPPEKLFMLKPESISSGGAAGDFINRWPMQGYEEFSFYCAYSKTTVRLSMPVPSGFKSCFVEHRANRPVRAWCE
jgi:hypothetical protein